MLLQPRPCVLPRDVAAAAMRRQRGPREETAGIRKLAASMRKNKQGGRRGDKPGGGDDKGNGNGNGNGKSMGFGAPQQQQQQREQQGLAGGAGGQWQSEEDEDEEDILAELSDAEVGLVHPGRRGCCCCCRCWMSCCAPGGLGSSCIMHAAQGI